MIETSAPQQNEAVVPTCVSAVGFTPGPWSFDGNSCGIVDGPDDRIRALVYGDGIGVGDSENPASMYANARLIAAAPALYEALEKVCGYLLNAQIDIETGAKRSTAVATIQGGLSMARAALKQARGE